MVNMFDFLKKKISNFVDKVTGKEEKKIEAEEPKAEEKPAKQVKPVEKPKVKEIKKPAKVKPVEKKTEPAEKRVEKPPEVKPEPVKKEKAEPVEVAEKPEEPEEAVKEEIPAPEVKEEAGTSEPEVKAPEPELKKPEPEKPVEPVEVKTREVKLGIVSRMKSLISREVEITEEDVEDTLESLELELIEGDVAMEVAESMTSELREKIIGSKVEKSKLNEFIRKQITDVLKDTMITGNEFDIIERVKEKERPVKILFLGINGSGKTTTIAKIAHLLMKNGFSVVLAGADTFRAAAIEQLEVHAKRLGVKMIKRDYGSDPTSVAYDAVSHAKAHGIDVVLVDTAGRQETNINLMNELKKIQRVIEPDIKLYIGESIGGSAVIEQVKSFNSEIGVDGIVLTKIDCDAKGGTVISAAKTSGVPVVLIGTGQKYDDIEIFDADKIVRKILG